MAIYLKVLLLSCILVLSVANHLVLLRWPGHLRSLFAPPLLLVVHRLIGNAWTVVVVGWDQGHRVLLLLDDLLPVVLLESLLGLSLLDL